MTEKRQLRILVAPLDWGLGHTSRCIPLIKHLKGLGHTVIVACNHFQANFIDLAIPGIEKRYLEGYSISYTDNDKRNRFVIAAQAPQIMQAVKKEHAWLQQHLATIKPDGIIADNRYGMYATDLPSVIITHQLRMQTGFGAIADGMMQKLHYGLLNSFNNVWVPDTPKLPKLAGKLSDVKHLPNNTTYIGWLSQFEGLSVPTSSEHLLVLLSGPEPQRTKLATLLWQQCLTHKGKVVFVAGTHEAAIPTYIPTHITYIPKTAGHDLATLIAAANVVVCRSGYSTIMDLCLFGKKALLIPTPGQAEQEYLAHYLHKEQQFYSTPQHTFVLEDALLKLTNYEPPKHITKASFNAFEMVVDKWLAEL